MSVIEWHRDELSSEVIVKARITDDDLYRVRNDPVVRSLLLNSTQTASDLCLILEAIFHMEDVRISASHPEGV